MHISNEQFVWEVCTHLALTSMVHCDSDAGRVRFVLHERYIEREYRARTVIMIKRGKKKY